MIKVATLSGRGGTPPPQPESSPHQHKPTPPKPPIQTRPEIKVESPQEFKVKTSPMPQTPQAHPKTPPDPKAPEFQATPAKPRAETDPKLRLQTPPVPKRMAAFKPQAQSAPEINVKARAPQPMAFRRRREPRTYWQHSPARSKQQDRTPRHEWQKKIFCVDACWLV